MERRKFLKVASLATGGLVIGFNIACNHRKTPKVGVLKNFNAYLSIDTNGIVEILNPVPEIGQGVMTSLPILIAEELEVSWKSIIVKQAKAGLNFEGSNQRAAGSNSVRTFWKPMRMAGASARELLKKAASEIWQVSIEDCFVKEGSVYNNLNTEKLMFGELVELASTFEIPKNIILKDKKDFTIIGTSPKNKSIEPLLTGKTKFGHDIRIEGTLYAGAEKSKIYGATVKSFNKSEILALEGVHDSFILPFHGDSKERPYCRESVVVVANSVWNLLKARKALKIDWDLGVNKNESTKVLHEKCISLLGKKPEYIVKNNGDANRFIATSDETYEATYHIPLIAHVPMETVNCTVDLKGNSCELWSTTQMPFVELNYISKFLDMPVENIQLHVTRIGGGFGRRLAIDFTIEALKIAQKIKNPVKFFWTREDDIQYDFYRPFSYHKLTAGIDKKGNLKAWIHKQVGTSRYAFRKNNKPYESEFFPNNFPANLIPNFRQEYSLLKTNLNRGLIRAPGNNALAFPIESFIDELARKTERCPLEYRLALLKSDEEFLFDEEENSVISTSRMRTVLKKVAKEANFGKELKKGYGLGIASYFTFDTYVAHVAEVFVDLVSGEFKVLNFTSAIDCGQVLHPDGVIAQVEGGILDGLSATIHQEITIKDGETKQSNFDNYNVLRMKDSPREINVHIVENEYPPTGVGEPPYPPVAPALCNAIFDACGIRIRSLPIKNQLEKLIKNDRI